VVELAAVFGQLPETVAAGMSELWFWRSAVYLNAKGQNTRKPRAHDPADFSSAAETDDQGAWILTE